MENHEQYLGWEIVRSEWLDHAHAVLKWNGHTHELDAPDVPGIRRAIWEWWFKVEKEVRGVK